MTQMTTRPNRVNFKQLLIFALANCGIALTAYVFIQQQSANITADDEFIVIAAAAVFPFDVSLNELSQPSTHWEPVTLPFHWRNQFDDTRAVWYRTEVTQASLENLFNSNGPASGQILGLYIWRLNQTADIWLNGTKIGSGGRSEEPMARHWNSPLYFSIPQSLLTETNELLIKHYAQHNWGSMEPIVIGTETSLKPLYENRYFIQHDIALGLFIFVLVTGAFSFSVWLFRKSEKQYFWFAIASLGLSFYCLNQFIRYLPLNADLWRWLSNVSTDLWATAMFVFFLRSLDVSKPKAEKLAYAYFFSGIPIYFYASYFHVFDINIYFHFGSILLGVYGFIISFQCYLQSQKTLALFYCSAILLIVVIGLHDTVMQAIVNNGLANPSVLGFTNHFNSVHFAAPLSFLFIAASLTKRFIDSMNAADKLNAELEQRVKEARQQLAENYQALELALIKQSAHEERERIFRDLHDDVGSKLLSLYYRLDNESDSTLAKSALEDLRDIVSHKPLASCSLDSAVSQWQAEAADRVSDAGIPLSWHFSGAGQNVELNELQHTQLRRMLREVFSNALLHSKDLSEIKVAIDYSDSTLSISVSSDGARKPVSEWTAGRGISNLRVRSRDLKGKFQITDLEGSWVQAYWTVPVDGPNGEAE